MHQKTNLLLSTPAYLIFKPLNESFMQGSRLGVLELYRDSGLIFIPDKEGDPVTIPSPEIAAVDFEPKFSYSSQFRMQDISGNKYIFVLDDNFSHKNKLRIILDIPNTSIPRNRWYGLSTRIEWRDALKQVLPDEKFKKSRPVHPAVSGVFIILALSGLFYVCYLMWSSLR